MIGAFDRLVRRLASFGIALAAIALIGSLVLIVYSVVLRYVLNQPAVWVDELGSMTLSPSWARLDVVVAKASWTRTA